MKYIVAFDTICQGWQCTTGEKGEPVLFSSPYEAWKEILDSAISHAKSNPDSTLVNHEQITEMELLMEKGTLEEIIDFFERNEECNEYEEFVVSETDYIQERKTIFT